MPKNSLTRTKGSLTWEYYCPCGFYREVMREKFIDNIKRLHNQVCKVSQEAIDITIDIKSNTNLETGKVKTTVIKK